MCRTGLVFFIFCLVVCHVLALGGGGRGGGGGVRALHRSARGEGSRYYGGDYHQQQPVREEPKKASATKASPARSGLGAWGYVAIILVLILGGAGIYYFTLFYPILCKKERKYDVMEMSAV